ncbi:MAG: sulfurtransferase [Persicimonas sp.]
MRHIRTDRLWLITLFVALTTLAIGCGSSVESDDPRPESERNTQPAELNSKVFVSAQEVQDLADDGATLLDARTSEDYELGHFPGAIQVNAGKPWKDESGYLIAWQTNDGELIGDVVEAQDKIRDLGIDADRPVVIYGDARSSGAGRLFWTLEYYGHGQVHFYSSGYENLKEELDFDEQTEAPAVDTGDFVVAFRNSVLATSEDVNAAIDRGDGILIDTRREGEFEGTEDRGDPRQGYIPEATWYYWENVFDEDDHLRSQAELEAEFEDVGLLGDDALIIPYCQTGTRSATIYAVLRWFGKDDAKNYDGSWVEWSRDEDLSIEQPQHE